MTSVQTLKLVILGESGVGKTSIVTQFVYNDFKEDQQPTYGASFLSKVITIDELDNQSVRFQIWDTAGQQKYRGLTPMYYRDAAAAICVYDITNSETFQKLDSWVEELRNNTRDCAIAIVGNKSDLAQLEAVKYQDARDFAVKNKTLFSTTSAKQRIGIDQLFAEIAKNLIQSRNPKQAAGPKSIKIDPKKLSNKDKNKKKCC